MKIVGDDQKWHSIERWLYMKRRKSFFTIGYVLDILLLLLFNKATLVKKWSPPSNFYWRYVPPKGFLRNMYIKTIKSLLLITKCNVKVRLHQNFYWWTNASMCNVLVIPHFFQKSLWPIKIKYSEFNSCFSIGLY